MHAPHAAAATTATTATTATATTATAATAAAAAAAAAAPYTLLTRPMSILVRIAGAALALRPVRPAAIVGRDAGSVRWNATLHATLPLPPHTELVVHGGAPYEPEPEPEPEPEREP